jgi:tetratricopeptide (TPR) repeat protein
LNPRFPDAWFNRAAYWKAQGEWARAEADFTHYIALDSTLKPQLADAHAQRGLLRLRQGRADEAQQDFDQCLRLNPRLQKSLNELIAEVKQQMTRKP